jgi:GTP-binding protein
MFFMINRLARLYHYRVALLGRPNVGKSSLFNALLGARLSLVDALPGFTRDCREARAALLHVPVTYIDTPGLDQALFARPPSLEKVMGAKSLQAAASADRILLVVDAKHGLMPDDLLIARLLSRQQLSSRTWLVANKSEGATQDFFN